MTTAVYFDNICYFNTNCNVIYYFSLSVIKDINSKTKFPANLHTLSIDKISGRFNIKYLKLSL